jgi:hypothetical protein
MILLISASWVTRITGMNHQCLDEKSYWFCILLLCWRCLWCLEVFWWSF